MLLIYTPNISNRLSYIIAVLFKKEGLLTQDRAQYEAWQGARINYSDTSILADDFQIIPHPLLFENELKYQAVECYHWEGLTAFFKTSTGAISFDIFAASFYLLSRYEEYLPHPVDAFGRYTHTDSVAFKNSFLHLPIVNLWVQELAKIVQKKYIDYQLAEASFMLTPTYDIDVAYCYLHQPIWKNVFGFFKDLLKGSFELFLERAKVYSGNQKDPFDQYNWLDELHAQVKVRPIYFFLVAAKRKGVDKNIPPRKKAMQELIINIAKKYAVGIHPSWQTGDMKSKLLTEITALKKIVNQSIQFSRQHYLRMELPNTYRQLIEVGITKEYTMGYGTINGFRASYANSFNWYDLPNETVTALEIHSFCYMDSTAIFVQQSPVYEAKKELQDLCDVVKKVNGEMICIVHNNFLSDQPEWADWKRMYADFLLENGS